ncbi:MAG: DNA-binding protein [Propionibacteriales bacterium]|nr:MAG: DNA-binding protein [Propionibacteriales bacterium]
MATTKKTLSGVWRRLWSSNAELESAELARSARRSGCKLVEECQLRDTVHLQGTVSVVTVYPPGSDRWFQAEMTDGSGSVLLVFMGRRVVPGISVGARIRVTGRLTLTQNRKAIYNPHYELV